MWKDITLIISLILAITFMVLFGIYYTKLSDYKKDKDLYLNNKEKDLMKREQYVKGIEDCSEKLSVCKNVSSEITQLLNNNKV
jgi:hypothetical protein